MFLKTIETLLTCLVCVWAFDDIYVNGEVSKEMIEQGRVQYQLVKEKSNLPQYGTCWLSAVEHIENGCKYLSEESQSDIALHLTNCFLEQSGHETYNCDQDRKPNLRRICLSSMTDRAFNVYTEFFTHTQNMCWFLRGQIWQDQISENTFLMTQQLEISTKNQKNLLEIQQENLRLQKKLLENGELLEEVLEGLYKSSKAHQEVLDVLNRNFGRFQDWVTGEITWIDSLIFYTVLGLFLLIVTSTKYTTESRVFILGTYVANIFIERLIFRFLLANSFLNEDILSYLWLIRYAFLLCYIYIICHYLYFYKDIHVENNRCLNTIQKQNDQILNILEVNRKNNNENFEVNANSFEISHEITGEVVGHKYLNGHWRLSPRIHNSSVTLDYRNGNGNGYNLRSRQNTPDPGKI